MSKYVQVMLYFKKDDSLLFSILYYTYLFTCQQVEVLI